MRRVEQTPPQRWGRWDIPVIDGVKYTRASSVGKALDDTFNLSQWQMRQVVLGIGRNPDLAAAASTVPADDKRKVQDIADKAMERAQSSASSRIGTAIHEAAELVDYGEAVDHLPSDLLADAKAYREALDAAGMKPVLAETFVVCDELQAAGTFDRVLLGKGGGFAIGDIKSTAPKGYDPVSYAALGWAVQLATYAHSVPYCADKGRMTWESVGTEQPSQEVGVVIHVTQGTGEASLYLLDLVAGWEFAQLAMQVRDARTRGRKLARPL